MDLVPHEKPMNSLLHPEFTALLSSADSSQAAFARLAGVTPRPGRQLVPRPCPPVPRWGAVLAVVLAQFTTEGLAIRSWAATG
jgi:hypothetical protein